MVATIASMLVFMGSVVSLVSQYNAVVASCEVVSRQEAVRDRRRRTVREALEEIFGTELGVEWLMPRICQKELVVENEYYFDPTHRLI